MLNTSHLHIIGPYLHTWLNFENDPRPDEIISSSSIQRKQ